MLVPDNVMTNTNSQAASPPLAEKGSLQEQLNQLLGSAAIERPETSLQKDREVFTHVMEERDQYRNE